jgi:hypothetical protein
MIKGIILPKMNVKIMCNFFSFSNTSILYKYKSQVKETKKLITILKKNSNINLLAVNIKTETFQPQHPELYQ